MNSSVTARSKNVTFFFIAVVVAAGLLAGSGFFLNRILSGNAGGIPESVTSCLATMRGNGFNPNTSIEGQIQVSLATTTGIETLVYKSGVIIASCPAYTLTDYCAGAGCQKPGVFFTLKKKEL